MPITRQSRRIGRYTLPALQDVARYVFYEMTRAYEPTAGDNVEDVDDCLSALYIDCRLVFGQNNWNAEGVNSVWTLNVGLSDYDQWHGHACGAESWDVTVKPTKAEAKRIARDLLAQVADQIAQTEGK